MNTFERLEQAISKTKAVRRTDEAEEGNWILKAGRIFKSA